MNGTDHYIGRNEELVLSRYKIFKQLINYPLAIPESGVQAGPALALVWTASVTREASKKAPPADTPASERKPESVAVQAAGPSC